MHLSKELVCQRELHDCGVACLAMAVNIDYEAARAVFDSLGLGSRATGSSGFGNGQAIGERLRPAYSSNFNDISMALSTFGLRPKIKRFRGWSDIDGSSIVKVSNGQKKNWHWVYANCSPEIGQYVLDPLYDLKSMEETAALSMCLNLSIHKPRGCFIEIRNNEPKKLPMKIKINGAT